MFVITSYEERKPKHESEHSKKLVVFLHGYGSNKGDLILLADEFKDCMPEAHFLSPDAPQQYEDSRIYGGRQWFSLIDRSNQAMLSGLKSGYIALDIFLKEQMEKLGIKSLADVLLIGFSQGAMLALYYGFRAEQELMGVIAYSGCIVGVETLSNEIKQQPKLLFVHGEEDDVVPLDLLRHSLIELDILKISYESHIIPKLAHGIDKNGIIFASRFISDIKHQDIK